MKKTALIMAGGRGERFWPKSRKMLPKQFLSLTNDEKTMLQLTVERILPLVDMEDIYIVTNNYYKSLVLEQLPDLPNQNILCEPIGRNTAPCIGLGAVHVASKYEDALMIVLPSDHLIKSNELFMQTLSDACLVAMEDSNLVTIGITPNYPETGYGYIKINPSKKKQQAFCVEQFTEKPDYKTAQQYLESGRHFWNSGMFIWKVSSILYNMSTFLPDTYDGLMKIKDSIGSPKEFRVLEDIFPGFTSESIDYGIMEKADNIYILPGNFGWDDVGSWLAIERIKGTDGEKNTISGNTIAINTHNCIIEASDKLIAAVGIEDMIIVDTADATLICPKNKSGDIKKILEHLKKENNTKYL